MRSEHLTESKSQLIALEARQAELLRHLGRTLASDRRWWGDSDEMEAPHRTVIRCEPHAAAGHYTVTVADAIGAIGLGNLQLIVGPKIPLNHFVYLLGESGRAPRVGGQQAELATDESFFVLVARWYLDACEELLRHDLIRDYESVTTDAPFARGRVHAMPTARAVMVGRPRVRCTYSHYGEDNPLNRVLRAAIERLAGSPLLSMQLRRRARRVHVRLNAAGALRHQDLLVRPDARTRYYANAHTLACTILAGWGAAPVEGSLPGSTFLFRTPEAIEDGVRVSLRRRLDDSWKVRKKGRTLLGTRGRVLNPDLVFGDDVAIGDVKYRISDGDITRSHLNQVTTFAAGYRATKASVVAFGSSVSGGEQVHVGDITVDAFNWNIAMADPNVAARALTASIEHWLRE